MARIFLEISTFGTQSNNQSRMRSGRRYRNPRTKPYYIINKNANNRGRRVEGINETDCNSMFLQNSSTKCISLTVRQDVNGLIVDVEEATEALADGHERSVAGVDVRIELEMTGHVAPSSQQQDLGRSFLLMHDGLGAAVHARPVVVLLTLRLVRVGVLVQRGRHRMARLLVGPKRRRATREDPTTSPRRRGLFTRGGETRCTRRGTRPPPRCAPRSSSQRRRRRHCIAAPSPACAPRRTGWQQPSSARDSASLTVPSSRQPSLIDLIITPPEARKAYRSLSRDLSESVAVSRMFTTLGIFSR